MTPEHCCSQERHKRQTGLLKNTLKLHKYLKRKRKYENIRNQMPFNQAVQQHSVCFTSLTQSPSAHCITSIVSLQLNQPQKDKKTAKDKRHNLPCWAESPFSSIRTSIDSLFIFPGLRGWRMQPPPSPFLLAPRGVTPFITPPQALEKELSSTTREEKRAQGKVARSSNEGGGYLPPHPP